MENAFFDTAAAGTSVHVSETRVERLQLVARAGSTVTLLGGSRDQGQLPSGATPYELLGMALGACTAMTIRLFAEHAEIPLDRVEVSVKYTPARTNQQARFLRILRIEGAFDERQKARLVDAASYCPVGALLANNADMQFELYDATTKTAAAPSSTEAATAFQYMDDIYETAMLMLKTHNF